MSSPEREVKHKVVNLILIYLFTNNAFYKIDNITYKYMNTTPYYFDSRLQWQKVAKTITKAKRALHAIRLIRKYVT